eukprot:SAG11_NODE_106_length_16423_cov_51.220840_26_plen_122_part_00
MRLGNTGGAQCVNLNMAATVAGMLVEGRTPHVFARQHAHAAALRSTTLEDIYELFDRTVAAGAPQRRRLCCLVYGTGASVDIEAENAAAAAGGGVVQRVERLETFRREVEGGAYACFPSLV